MTAESTIDRARLASYQEQLTEWRRDFHRHPELAFEEVRTSGLVADRLREFGLEPETGIGGTGVVAVIESGSSERSIGLRADMDALPIHEQNAFDHKSTCDGKMHACGHDGHTSMLLGAARYLSETRDFDGRVVLIFQPAEEKDGGAREMIRDGLFDRFSIDQVYGMHNLPGTAVGEFALCSGPMMAAIDTFEARVVGIGGHAAFPHGCKDGIVAAAQIVSAWQSIVARNVDPIESAVISTTMIHAGDAFNVLPAVIELGGCVRTFDPNVQDLIQTRLREIGEALCAAHDLTFEFEYNRYYPATVNSAAEVERSARAVSQMGMTVDTEMSPIMGSEDFSFMLQERPGAFVMTGNGPSSGLHTPLYDFNDALLSVGTEYWVTLVQQELASVG